MWLVNAESFPARQNLISKNVGATVVAFEHACVFFKMVAPSRMEKTAGCGERKLHPSK